MRWSVPLLLLAFGPLMAQDPVDSRGWINRGVQAFREARYPEATAAFQKAVQLDPANSTARLYLGTAYMQQYIPGAESPQNKQMAQLANDEFVKVVDQDPRNIVAMSSLASLYLNQKKWDDALEWYGKLTAVDPNHADAYYSIGFIAWSKWYPAYAAARAKLGMKPQDPGPIPDPSVRQDLKANYGPALEAGMQALDRALQINPQYDDAMAYMNLFIRERADLRDTPEEYQQDIVTADQWVQKALATKRTKAGGLSRSSSAPPPPPPPPPPGSPAPQRIQLDPQVQERKLIHKVDPVYPPLASQARISGTVRLTVIIGKDGRVANITVVSGHPLLIPAAIEAVKQWVYQPTLLNGNPVEVMAPVDVFVPVN